MNLKQLNYFVRIAELGSYSAAARDLNVAQSALSTQMSKFEAQLKVLLFYRSRRGVELTEPGQRLLEHAHLILHAVETAEHDIQPHSIEPEGQIRVGMIPTINNVLASRLYETAKIRYPKMRIDISTGPSLYLNRLLESGQLDLSIAHADKKGFGEMRVSPILRERLYFVFAKSFECKHLHTNRQGESTIQFTNIAHYPILSTEHQDGLGFRIKQYANKHGVALQKRPSLGQLVTDITEIATGSVCMILPWSAIHNQLSNYALTTAEIVEPKLERDVYLITNPKRRLTHNLMKTQALVQTLFPETLQAGYCKGELIT